MPRRLLAIVAAEIAVLAFVYLRASRALGGEFGFPLDDSWIYAVFARNIAHGHGMAYNPGQPVAPTGMLYALLLGGFYRLVAAPVIVADALGLLLHLGASVLIYATVDRITGERAAAAMAAVFFAAVPRLIWGALSGMEVSLYVFLVTLGLYWQVRYRSSDGTRAHLATAAFALATLARPECGAFLGASMLERLYTSAVSDGGRSSLAHYMRSIPVHLLLFAVIVAPAVIFNLRVSGLPMPPAFYAKTAVSERVALSSAWAGVGDYVGQAFRVSVRDNTVLAYLMLVGAAACGCWALRRTRTASVVFPLAFALVPAAVAVMAHRRTGTNQLLFQSGRYSAYLAPLVVVMAAVGFAAVRGSVERAHIPGVARKSVTVGVALAAGWFFVIGNIHGAEKYAWDVCCINNMQVAIGKWAASLPGDTVLAVNDAGAIAYFSRKHIIDTVGVVNPEVIPYLDRHRSRQAGLLEYLAERRPDYVALFPNWYRRIASRTDLLRPVLSVKLRRNTICGGDEMVVYRAKWTSAEAEPDLGSSR